MNKLTKVFLGLAGLASLYALLVLSVGQLSSNVHDRAWQEPLGNLLWEELSKLYTEVEDSTLTATLNDMTQYIAQANHMEAESIQVHILRAYEPNAVTLPGGHIVVFTGLLRLVETPEELAGILAHELAHIRLNHVSEKVIREVGINVLVIAAGGGSEVGQVAAALLSNAFSREAEKEADMQAIVFLQTAHIDPQGLATVLQRFADMEGDYPEALGWLSTHPLSKERVEYVTKEIAKKKGKQNNYGKVPGAERWEALKRAVE
jgi:predicted Zn-dependent protease